MNSALPVRWWAGGGFAAAPAAVSPVQIVGVRGMPDRATARRIAGVARRRTRVTTAVPAESPGPQAVPEQERQQAADEPDEHQDPADDVDVDRGIRIALVHGEREDGAHGDQDQADGKSHGSDNPPWRRLPNGLRRE